MPESQKVLKKIVAEIKTKGKTRLNFPYIFQPWLRTSYFSSTAGFHNLGTTDILGWLIQSLAASSALTH